MCRIYLYIFRRATPFFRYPLPRGWLARGLTVDRLQKTSPGIIDPAKPPYPLLTLWQRERGYQKPGNALKALPGLLLKIRSEG